MTIRLDQAKVLCTKTEWELFLASRPRASAALSPAMLKRCTVRSRKLRDKYRELANRQEREARGKQSPKGHQAAQGNERTRRKEQLFQEMLDRFEKQLEAVQAKSNTVEVTKSPRTKRKTATKMASGAAAGRSPSTASPGTVKKSRKKASATAKGVQRSPVKKKKKGTRKGT